MGIVANALGNTGVIDGPGSRQLFIDSRTVRVRLRTGDVWERTGIEAVGVTPNRVWLVGTRLEAYRFDATEEGVLAASWPLALNPSAIDTRGQRFFAAGTLPSGVSFLQLDESGVSDGPIRVVQPLVIGAARFVSDDEVLLARGDRLDVVRPASLDGSVSLSASSMSSLIVLSASADGVWTTDERQVRLRRPDGGVSAVELPNLPTGMGLPPIRLTDVVPIWPIGRTASGSMVTAVPVDGSDGGLAWRYIETPETTPVLWSSSRWLSARGPSGVLFRAPRVP